jgi:hypothetical protein
MPNRLGPLEVNCDAPPYNIVRACQMIGLRSPEDVRWSRLSQFVGASADGRESVKGSSWRSLLGMSPPECIRCTCGQKLPLLEQYTFTLISGRQTSYLIGQCSRCLAIYWQEAQPRP